MAAFHIIEISGPRAPTTPDSGATGGDGRAISAADTSGWDAGAELPPRWQFAAPWRTTVEQRRVSLWNELARLDNLTPTGRRERDALRALLKDAQDATQEKVWLGKWWWGTEVERAWTRLHEVEERIVDLVPVEELELRATMAARDGARHLKSDDKQLVALEARRADVAAGKGTAEVLRPAVVEMIRRVHDQTDRDNREARYLRNRILLASVMCLVVSGGILFVQSRLPEVAFLSPNDALEGRPTAYLFLVMTFAALGALLTAIPSLSQLPSAFSPFNLPLQQAVLKVAFGPLLAVVGFAILQVMEDQKVDIVNVAVPTTVPALVVTAVVFGAAQHLVTRYVDRRADEVLAAFVPKAKAGP